MIHFSVQHHKPNDRGVEIVESKQQGHPDRLCEEAARFLNLRMEQLGFEINGERTHFQVDSVLLSSGVVADLYRIPRIVRPFRLIVSGQVSTTLRSHPMFEAIVEQTISAAFAERYGLTHGIEYQIENLITASSGELEQNFRKHLCADTAFVLGFAKETKLEQTCTQLESFFGYLRQKLRSIGQDVKILAISPDDQTIELIISVAMIREHISNLATYQSHLFFIEHYLRWFLETVSSYEKVSILLNQADQIDPSELSNENTWDTIRNSSVYLTRSGFSAEHQDDGALGRGNRDYHRTSSIRSQTNETVVGKNPHHSSVVYQRIATIISRELDSRFGCTTEILIVSKIGAPINEPLLVRIDARNADRSKDREMIQTATELFLRQIETETV